MLAKNLEIAAEARDYEVSSKVKLIFYRLLIKIETWSEDLKKPKLQC